MYMDAPVASHISRLTSSYLCTHLTSSSSYVVDTYNVRIHIYIFRTGPHIYKYIHTYIYLYITNHRNHPHNKMGMDVSLYELFVLDL